MSNLFLLSRYGKVHTQNCLLTSSKLAHLSFTRRNSSSGSTNSSSSSKKQQERKRPYRVIFLGTPNVSALSLQMLISSSNRHTPHSNYDIIGVITQPPAPSGNRGMKLISSAVQQYTEQYNNEMALAFATTLELDRGGDRDRYRHTVSIPILTPTSARDESFLRALQQLQPDLCITVAYGNYLPKAFLNIPKYGTLNIHPSLLPKYRGAAPIQRYIEHDIGANGGYKSGVSIVETVSKMDAGPIVRQEVMALNGNEHAPELLEALILKGTLLLVETLPHYFIDSNINNKNKTSVSTNNSTSDSDSASASATATANGGEYKDDHMPIKYPKLPQDDSLACTADKLTTEESYIQFDLYSASFTGPPRSTYMSMSMKIHNKVRAFSGWPGVWTEFKINDAINDKEKEKREGKRETKTFSVQKIKIIATVLLPTGTATYANTGTGPSNKNICLKQVQLPRATCPVYDIATSQIKCSVGINNNSNVNSNSNVNINILHVVCADNSHIGITHVQPPGKKIMDVKSYVNGLRGRTLTW